MAYSHLKNNIEYIIGPLAAVTTNELLGRALETAVVGVVSLAVGLISIVLIHFLRRRLQRKYPINK